MSTPPPLFDELYAVSDLHLGGPPGCQIFNQGQRLHDLIQWVARRAQSRRVCFVINGDFIDFLALSEARGMYLDADGASTKVAAVAVDPAFAPVFSALRDLTAAPQATLVLVIGNHDLEMTLPSALSTLLGIICKDPAARGRVLLALDGAGFRCRVGDAVVLCVHGNEVDPWNVVDHEQLRLMRQAINRGRPVRAWEPNAGTCLVVDVLNEAKRQLPMIDLLKPETEAVRNLLPIVYPASKAHLLASAPILQLALRRARGGRETAVLGGEASDNMPPTVVTDSAAVLALAMEDYRAGRDPLQLGAAAEGETLGTWQYLLDRFNDVDKTEAARRALRDWLRNDESFEPQTPDETFHRLDETVGPDVDFVVAGHTHLMRALARRDNGFYFNTGTWIRLIQLSGGVLDDVERFRPIFAALMQKEMRVLDETPGVILRRSTVAAVRSDGDAVIGELCDADYEDGALMLRRLIHFTR